jgi:penicillin-binding protein 1A
MIVDRVSRKAELRPIAQREWAVLPRKLLRSGILLRLVVFSSCAVVIGAACGFFAGTLWHVPSLDGTGRPDLASRVLGPDGRELALLCTQRRTELGPKGVPDLIKNALIAAEDSRFYKHGGVDPLAIGRAIWGSIRTLRIGGRGGGSTITQQLARELFLRRDQSIARKIREAILAVDLEKRFSKDEILTRYANEVYFGHGAWGIEAASQVYFNCAASELGLEQAAALAALIPAPEGKFDPISSPVKLRDRRNRVLKQMLKLGSITPEDYGTAAATPLNASLHDLPLSQHSHFLEAVRQEMVARYGYDTLYRGGLAIKVTMDPVLQHAAEAAVQDGLKHLEDKVGLRQPPLEAALIALDNRSGAVLALVGGRDFRSSQFNRATQSILQPGSAFKIFVYIAAVEHGFTSADTLLDAPVLFPDATGTTYCPKNYSPQFYGITTLRRAFEESYNVTAVKLHALNGLGSAVACARRLGINTPLAPYPSLALGSMGVRPIELAAAYAAVANEGELLTPFLVTSVIDRDGKILDEATIQGTPVMSPQVAFVMLSLLRGVVEHGTGKDLRDLGIEVAGKTGTTDDYTDAWFVGSTPRITVAVWVGRDRKLPIGPRVSGSVAALPIWKAFMQSYVSTLTAEQRNETFPAPPGVVFVLIDPSTGLRATPRCTNVVLEAFLEGTEPSATCSERAHQLLALPWPFQVPSYHPRHGEAMPSTEAIAAADRRLSGHR